MEKSFFHTAGPMALGSRLRQLSDRITQESAVLYRLYGVDMEPRWFPVLYALMQQDGQSVAQLATAIGHSQASVSQIIKEMHRQDFVQIDKAATDARKTIVTLTEKAHAVIPTLKQQIDDVGKAIEGMFGLMQHDLWKALDELDYLLDEQSLSERVGQQRKQRESQQVRIVPFTDAYHDAFRQLNQAWITTYFEMEDADYQALDHPQEKIIEPGGCILIALYDEQPVGTCALIRTDERTYELAKMAVAPAAQNKHIGWQLGRAIIDKARELGATTVFLESNTRLKPALHLYQKLGFRRVKGTPSPYARSNIKMELTL